MAESPSGNIFAPRFFNDGSSSPLPFFRPGPNGRDNFGNRVFTHHTTAFRDRSGSPVRAELRISQEGLEFVKANRGITRDIEIGLGDLNRAEYFPGNIGFSRKDGPSVSLGISGERTMSYLTDGGESAVYLVETPTGRYIVEARNPRLDNLRRRQDPTQPYVNEMLQVMSLQADLKELLDSAGVVMPRFLLASPVFSCQVYEEGKHIDEKKRRDLVRRLSAPVKKYISDQKINGNPLWTNIMEEEWRETNFIARPDGTVVWVDSVCYDYNVSSEAPSKTETIKFTPKPR